MTQTAVLNAGANPGTTTVSGNAISYYGTWGGQTFISQANQTETSAQVKNRGAATLQNANVQVPSNLRFTTTTLTSRVNTAAGNISITINAGSTGVLSDTTHSDSLADGDLYNYKVLTGASNEALGISGISAQLVTSGQATKPTISFNINNPGFSIGVPKFIAPHGSSASSSTESGKQTVALESATLSNLQVLVTASSTAAPTMSSRVNGTTVTQVVTLAASTTGLFEDVTHTDSVISNDLFNVVMQGINATRTIGYCGFKYLGATTNVAPVYGGSGPNAGSAATNYWAFGSAVKSTTESDTKLPMPAAGTAASLAVIITANTTGTNQNFQFRLNGANGNQVASVTANTTGTFSDSTHSDTIAAGDLINCSTGSGFTTTNTLSAYGFLFTAGGAVADTLFAQALL